MKYKAIVIGASSGGIEALKVILSRIEKDIKIPIIIVIHLPEVMDSGLPYVFGNLLRHSVKEAEDKECLQTDTIYFAPGMYHLQIEDNLQFSLSLDEKVNHSRPAIDILFETAAETFKGDLMGILLTGANSDGAWGMKRIEALGGRVLVQDPETADMGTMPKSALEWLENPEILDLEPIGDQLNHIQGDINYD